MEVPPPPQPSSILHPPPSLTPHHQQACALADRPVHMCLSLCAELCICVHTCAQPPGIQDCSLMCLCQTRFSVPCSFPPHFRDSDLSWRSLYVSQKNLPLPFLMTAEYSVARMCPECERSCMYTSWHTCSKTLGLILRRKLLHHKACLFSLWLVGSNCPPQRQHQPEPQQRGALLTPLPAGGITAF